MSQWHTGAVKLSERIKSTFYTHAIINLQYNHPVLRHDLLIAPCSKLHLAYDSDKACMWYPCRVKASPCRVNNDYYQYDVYFKCLCSSWDMHARFRECLPLFGPCEPPPCSYSLVSHLLESLQIILGLCSGSIH